MKPDRKNGETHAQFIKRLESYIGVLEDNNRALRITNKQLALQEGSNINPRTMKSYKDEAQTMFFALALAEHAVRTNQTEILTMFIRQPLFDLGFNEIDLYEDKCLQDGAYNGEKS